MAATSSSTSTTSTSTGTVPTVTTDLAATSSTGGETDITQMPAEDQSIQLDTGSSSEDSKSDKCTAQKAKSLMSVLCCLQPSLISTKRKLRANPPTRKKMWLQTRLFRPEVGNTCSTCETIPRRGTLCVKRQALLSGLP